MKLYNASAYNSSARLKNKKPSKLQGIKLANYL